MKLDQKQVQHLFVRAGFGIGFQDAQRLAGKKPETLFADILSNSQKVEEASIIDRVTAFKNFMAMKEASSEEKKAIKKNGRELLKNLNAWWLERMVQSDAFLREKMTLFWHDHFACRINNTFLMQQQHNTLRKHALGSFRDLLHAVSKDPAMLQFLNNQQNRKRSPNENFAREVMELFTLGRGHYSEQDIKEAARAFTGWGFNTEGEFIFRKRAHDEGKKTVFGKTGNFGGEDVLNLLLEKKQTARYITKKLFKYFVSDEPDEAIIERLAMDFYDANYDISALLTSIFTADWFYEEQFIGNKIKSPIELIAGIGRQFNISFDSVEPIIYMQKILGQVLLMPPNVAGWPEGTAWIDSSTLMFRMRLTELLFVGAELQVMAKDNGDAGDVFRGKKEFRKMTANINWDKVINDFKKMDSDESFTAMKTWLLQKEVAPIQTSKHPDDLRRLKENALKITQLPEFQLC